MQINGFTWDLPVSVREGNPLLVALAVVIFAESALLAGAAGYLVFEIFTAVPDSYPSAIFLTFLTALAAGWLAIVGVHTLRGSPWIRGAAVAWQVLQVAVAVGCFQGLFARPDIGWALLLPAIAVLVLLFTRPVLAATARAQAVAPTEAAAPAERPASTQAAKPKQGETRPDS